MSIKAFALGVAALMWALPAAAQERGTLEFGAFGSLGSFDNDLSLKSGYGGGGRLGAYLNPNLSIEFEDAEMRASRPNGLKDVNVGILSGRLVGVPAKRGGLSFLVGAGAGVSTETNFMHTYGLDVLAGVKLAINKNMAFRVDGVWDWLANEDWKSYRSVRAGLTVYRSPNRHAEVAALPPMMMHHDDSVSAAETRRLRASEMALRALRDSLARVPAPVSPANVATMQARIHFAFDKSDLTDSAKAILDDKVAVFRDNPTMSIMVMGYADNIGTDAYNMALGTRRAEAAKAYIVSKGIDGSRIIIDSKGERQPVTEASGVAGQAPNRRAIFRLSIASDGSNQEE